MPAVYLETTIPSFLTARPSTDKILVGKQEVTRQWWENRRNHYDLFISQYVLDEAAGGDPVAAARRLAVIGGIDLLEVDDAVLSLAGEIVKSGLIPERAKTDAAHIAVAARHGVDFLLTWNCTHIANAEIMGRIQFVVTNAGYNPPTICTPDELFGGEYDEN